MPTIRHRPRSSSSSQEGVRRRPGALRRGQAPRGRREVQGVVPALARTRCSSTTSASRSTKRGRRTRRCSTTASSSPTRRETAPQRKDVDEARRRRSRRRTSKPISTARRRRRRPRTTTTHDQARPSEAQDRRQDQAGRHVQRRPTSSTRSIEAAPPGKPLDVTAFVPEDSGWTVTLYFRGSGDAKFIAKPMKWRYKELVARIPGGEGRRQLDPVLHRGQGPGRQRRSRAPASRRARTSSTSTRARRRASTRTSPTTARQPISAAQVEAPRRRGSARRQQAASRRRHRAGDGRASEEPGRRSPAAGNGFNDVGSIEVQQGEVGLDRRRRRVRSAARSSRTSWREAAGRQPRDRLDCDVRQRRRAVSSTTTTTRRRRTPASATTRSDTRDDRRSASARAGASPAYFWYRELTAKKHGELQGHEQDQLARDDAGRSRRPAIGDGFTGAAAAARF